MQESASTKNLMQEEAKDPVSAGELVKQKVVQFDTYQVAFLLRAWHCPRPQDAKNS